MNQPDDTVGQSPGSIPTTLAIYRDLRVGMVVIMVMLAAAVVIERLWASGWQSALSEYYYTSAHSVFIAALVALSTLFFVYKGSSDTEDALLTLAGVCTLVAALVPQDWPPLVYGDHDLPRDYEAEPVVLPNMWAVVVALVLGWLLTLRQYRHTNSRQTRSAGGTLTLYLLRLIVTVALITLAFCPDTFKKYAHGAAGTLMLTAFIATVFCTAYLAGQEEKSGLPGRHLYTQSYRVMAAVMVGTFFAVLALHLAPRPWLGELWILVLETLLILKFAVYWVVQTIDLWDTPDRGWRLSEHAQELLAQKRTKTGLRGLASEVWEAKDGTSGERLLPLL